MKLVSYIKEEREQLGVLINDMIYDMEVLHPDLPNSMGMFLNYWEDSISMALAGADVPVLGARGAETERWI